MYSLTVFKSKFDNKTHRRMDFESWDKFEKFLYKLSERPLEGKKMLNLYHRLLMYTAQLEQTKMSLLGDLGVLLMLMITNLRGT